MCIFRDLDSGLSKGKSVRTREMDKSSHLVAVFCNYFIKAGFEQFSSGKATDWRNRQHVVLDLFSEASENSTWVTPNTPHYRPHHRHHMHSHTQHNITHHNNNNNNNNNRLETVALPFLCVARDGRV